MQVPYILSCGQGSRYTHRHTWNRNVDLSQVREKMPCCLIDPGAMCLTESRQRQVKPSTHQLETVPYHVTGLGTEGREDR